MSNASAATAIQSLPDRERDSGAAYGIAFEEGARGIHHRDDSRRERHAEDERRSHRQRGHDVESDLTVTNAAQDLDHERVERGIDPRNSDELRDVGWLAAGHDRHQKFVPHGLWP